MKTLEKIIEILLVIVLLFIFGYLILEMTNIEMKFKMSGEFILISFFVAGMATLLFPIWPVKKGQISSMKIGRFIEVYKTKFAAIGVAYLGLMSWYVSTRSYDIWFVSGLLLLILGLGVYINTKIILKKILKNSR